MSKPHFDISNLLNEIEIQFGKTITPSEIKKDYCRNRTFFRKIIDLSHGDTDDFNIVKIKSGRTPGFICIGIQSN